MNKLRDMVFIRSVRDRREQSCRKLFAAVCACLLLGGCAAQQTRSEGPSAYDALYSGKSGVAYATQMPVGSAGEAALLGDQALEGGDLDRALFEYIRALKKGGDNADLLYKIGTIHAARNNTRLAEAAFRWALRGNPKHAGALAGLGIILTRGRDYAQAESHLRAAVRADPRMARTHNALGVLADMQRDHGRAQQHFEDALALAADSPQVLNNLGYSRYLSGNQRGAIAAFQEAIKTDPSYKRAWRNLALVYARQRNYEKALDALSKVQDIPKAYNDVGYVAMVGGRLDDAESFFDEAMRQSPQYYELAGLNAQRLRAMKGGSRIARR
jgi:Flp pilus assembly protein TadD